MYVCMYVCMVGVFLKLFYISECMKSKSKIVDFPMCTLKRILLFVFSRIYLAAMGM